jgi:4-hydroxy-3-methylbut-2-enyl diphosphate reductase
MGIEQAYQAMNKIAADRESTFAVHQCTTPHKNAEWDTLKRIETKDAALMSRYPNLRNISVLDPHDLSNLQAGDMVVVGFHGVGPEVRERLERDGAVVDDRQCPFISRLNDTIETLVMDGFDIIIFGKRGNHHCLEAHRLAEIHGRRCVVAERPEDIETLPNEQEYKWAFVGQVTGNTLEYNRVKRALQKENIPVKIVETVCSDSYLRQNMGVQLAQKADVVIVVDDGSGSSLSVFEVCDEQQAQVYRIRSKAEIQREWFDGCKNAAIVGGILVPQWILDDVAMHVEQLTGLPL